MAFRDLSTIPIHASVATGNVKVGRNNNYGNFAGNPVSANVQAGTLASADPLPIDTFNDEYIVSGTTNFGNMPNGWKGRKIQLQFSSVLTVFNGTSSATNIRLLGGANFVAGSGSILYLYHNGVQWLESGRA